MNKTCILRYGYLLAIAALLAGLPLSKFLTSIGEFLLAAVWIVDVILNKDLAQRLKSLFKNKAALTLLSLYLLHVIGLLWTKNFDYGFHDLRIKAPLFIFPVIFATIPPLSSKEIKAMLHIYLLSNLLGVCFALYYLFFREMGDIRQIVWFNSHIRFGLNIVTAIMASMWLMKSFPLKKKTPYIILILIFGLFLIRLQAMTALLILLFIIGFYALKVIFFTKNKRLKYVVIGAILIACSAIFFYVYNIYKDTAVPKESKELIVLDKTTSRGNPYQHNTSSGRLENGYWVEIYISEPEMKEAWETRSELSFDGQDLKGHELKATLIRYLTGKGVRKDAEGIAALSDQDIRNIENGIANHYYAEHSSVKNRIRVIVWEFHVWQCCNQIAYSSVVQRFELWRAAWYTIKNNFLFGVGTGDVGDAQRFAYTAVESTLPQNMQVFYRVHNQYISMFSAFGIFGFLWFLFTLVYPGVKTKRFSYFLYATFFITIAMSMLAEDTLETQAGVTFFAFFNCFFLFLYSPDNAASDLE
ncbi:MAG: O-antigen ligase family protein [Bacteroidales bacterium]|jgi:hypothetical protein|nr:O-antigen ligase family protein [Bacteroidales bacterium]